MKIEFDNNLLSNNRVDSYSTGSVTISGIAYSHSVIVVPDGPVRKWEPEKFSDLALQHFSQLLAEKPELIILDEPFSGVDAATERAYRHFGMSPVDPQKRLF